MNIGDRVRMLHDDQEGIISRFLEDNQVEIEIEDGFTIPVLRSDVVLVHRAENQYFKPETVPHPVPRKRKKQRGTFAFNNEKELEGTPVKPIAKTGIFLAFKHLDNKNLEVFVINNTDFELLFTLASLTDGRKFSALSAGHLQPKSFRKTHEVKIEQVWPDLVFSSLFHRRGMDTPKKPLSVKSNFDQKLEGLKKGIAPVLEEELYLLQLDGQAAPQRHKAQLTMPRKRPKRSEPEVASAEERAQEQMAQRLRESMMGGRKKVKDQIPSQRKGKTQIDLHIEELHPSPRGLEQDEILNIQLKAFEKHLDIAIASGQEEVTFIHGVGAGKLRTEIHRRLAQNEQIQHFQDAMRERFGYGATTVKI